MTYPVVCDISNYDYDDDQDEPQWAAKFLAAGITGIIVGSQWPYKAASQIAAARAAGLSVVGTYAEPDVAEAINLATSCGAKQVGLACERGGIVTSGQLTRAMAMVRDAGLRPWVYGNASDLLVIAGQDLLYRPETDIWLANYGWNDPANPRGPLTEWDFGRGPKPLIAHQFSSTMVIAGRNRDHSYYYGRLVEIQSLEEEDALKLTEKQTENLLLRAFAGGEFVRAGETREQRLDRALAELDRADEAQSLNDVTQSAILVALSGSPGGPTNEQFEAAAALLRTDVDDIKRRLAAVGAGIGGGS